MAASKRSLDFTNVQDGSRFSSKRVPEGDYIGRIIKVEDKDSKNDNPMWVFTIEIATNGVKGTYPYYCLLEAKHLWKVRALFAAAGLVLPKKRLQIDPNKLVNRQLGVTVEDDEYEGKVRSRISWTIPISEVVSPDAVDEDTEADEDEEEEEEEEEPPPPPARRRTSKKAPEPEPEEEEEEAEEEEAEEEEEAPPPPRKRTPAKPAPTAKKAAAVRTGRAKRPIPQVDDDDLEELDIDDV